MEIEPNNKLREWQVKERWGIDQITLAEYVYKDGLRAYDINGRQIRFFDLYVAAELELIDGLRNGKKIDINDALEHQLEIHAPIIAQFISDDIIDFEREYNLYPAQQTSAQLTEEQTQTFIKSLSMAYISETEISIKSGDKKVRKRDKGKLGFNKEGKAKIWNAFIKVFKSKNHYFNLNETDATSKDSARKYLAEINNKLITFLNKEYRVKISDGFKLYEKVQSEGPGIYQFKFAIDEYIYADKEEFNKLSDEELLSKFKALAIKFKKANNSAGKDADPRTNKIQDKLLTAVKVVRDRKLLDEIDIRIIINPNQQE